MSERGNLERQQTHLLFKGYVTQPPSQPVRHALGNLIFVVDNDPALDADFEQQLSQFCADGIVGAVAQRRHVFDLVDLTQGAVWQHPQGYNFIVGD